MIVEEKAGKNVFETKAKGIAFAVNTEGVNDAGFAGFISEEIWPELRYIGPCELGSVLTKEVNGKTYYALVCHSLHDGWRNQHNVIKKCFDKIADDGNEVASIRIGTGMVGVLQGANFEWIREGMEDSKARIILY